jgi:cyclophilin family peptidyl-prolyl cis-trans isomerase
MSARLLSLGAAAITLSGCAIKDMTPTSEIFDNKPSTTPTPAAQTAKGKIVVELYPAKAPKTCEQILRLIDTGFYEGQRVHRVEPWVVQWGDPQSKADDWESRQVGSQGSGKQLPYEATDIKMQAGTLAMASTGEKVGGDSQVFILTSACTADQASFLQAKYCAFGKVLSGMDVVDKVSRGDKVSMKRQTPAGADKTAPVKVEITVTGP